VVAYLGSLTDYTLLDDISMHAKKIPTLAKFDADACIYSG
jgi:hypothetical protein